MRRSARTDDQNIWQQRLEHLRGSAFVSSIKREYSNSWNFSGELSERLFPPRNCKHLRSFSMGRGNNSLPKTPAASNDDHVFAAQTLCLPQFIHGSTLS
jgi:hypothetical protein